MAMSPRLLRPRASGFNPRSIPGLAVWLDASKASSVTLDGNGDYTFTLQDSLDHDAANGENSLGLTFDLTGTPSSTTATEVVVPAAIAAASESAHTAPPPAPAAP